MAANRRVNIDIKGFHKSLSDEFEVLKDRVKYLIGDKHWGEEGRYKEILLTNMIKRYLPKNLSIGTGFIMNSAQHKDVSTQVDIIIYENDYPLIFQEGDFVIVNSKNVVGIIEVKSSYYKAKFGEILKKSEAIAKLTDRKIFNGIFYYNNKNSRDELDIQIEEILKHSNGSVNHIAVGGNKFVKFWKNGNPGLHNNNPSYSLYNIDIAFSYFLFNLIESIYMLTKNNLDNTEKLDWFFYPIQETKEVYRTSNIEIE